MTPKSLLITALAVGFLLFHGTGAVPMTGNTAQKEMTDEELAALDKQLEELSTEDVKKYLNKQRLDQIDWLKKNRENLKLKIDEFVDKSLAALAKEPTPEEIAALDKNLSNFSVETVKANMAKSKQVMDKFKSVMAEVAAIFPAQAAPQ